MNLSCSGFWSAAGAIPPNTTYYGDNIHYYRSGRTNCKVVAQNEIGETATAFASVSVYEYDTEGGQVVNCTWNPCPPPNSPTLPPPPGVNGSSTTGNPLGYYNPNTGLTYSDPAGTQVCGNCRTDTGQQTNDQSETGGNPSDTPGRSEG